MEETFNQAYTACTDSLYRIAMVYLGSPAEAEDVLQDVFVKLLGRGKPFVDETHQKRWLIRVTINLCKDRLRSAWHRKTVPIEQAAVAAAATENREILELVLSLPPAYKAAVHLHYYEGYTVAEIARILGLTQGAVKMRLQRGRDYLRMEMEEKP